MNNINEVILINKINTEIINLIEEKSISEKILTLSNMDNTIIELRQNYLDKLKRHEIVNNE